MLNLTRSYKVLQDFYYKILKDLDKMFTWVNMALLRMRK